MKQDKHSYIIIGLLIVIIVLLVMVFNSINTPAKEFVGGATERIAQCQEDINEWNAEHGSEETLTESERAELYSIIQNCIQAIGEENK